MLWVDWFGLGYQRIENVQGDRVTIPYGRAALLRYNIRVAGGSHALAYPRGCVVALEPPPLRADSAVGA
jgi:hypothetical protein